MGEKQKLKGKRQYECMHASQHRPLTSVAHAEVQVIPFRIRAECGVLCAWGGDVAGGTARREG